MKKMINNVIVSGRVYDHSLAIKTTGATSKKPGTEYINGTLDVAVDNEGYNIVSVNFTYVTALTSKGTKNATYGILKSIIDENKTVLNVGADAATIVSITGSIGLNEFYTNRNGEEELVSAKRVEGSFVKTLKFMPKNEDERNLFECDMLINGTRLVEADPEKNIDEDYLVVKGAIFNFKNAILPVEFIIKGEKGIQYFENLEASSKNLVFSKIWGRLNYQTISVKKVEEAEFGEPVVKEYERKIKEWIINRAKSGVPVGDENSITEEEITKCLADREVYLADIKKRAEDYRNSQAAAKAGTATQTSTNTISAAAGGFNF